MQKIREMIPTTTYKEFHALLIEFTKNYSKKTKYRFISGLLSEGKAFHYLSARFKKQKFYISNSVEDQHGIDITSITHTGTKLTFQVKSKKQALKNTSATHFVFIYPNMIIKKNPLSKKLNEQK